MRTPALLVALLSVVAVGCRGKDPRAQNARKLTATSENDATAPIVDEDYRFRIAWPGKGWKLMHEQDIRRVMPDAVAGAIAFAGEGALYFAVVVASVKEAELHAYAKLAAESLPLTDREAHGEEVTYLGQPAMQYLITGTTNGVPFRYVYIIFLRQGHAYQLLGWGTRAQTDPKGAFARPFLDAFTLLDGEIKPRAATTRLANIRGVGWRLQNALFESVVGVAVRADPPWRLALGEELKEVYANAEVGLVRNAPDVYLVLEGLPGVPAEDRDRHARAIIDDFGARNAFTATSGTGTVRLAGEEVVLHRFGGTAETVEHAVGVHYREDRAFFVYTWYPAADAEAARAALPGALTGVSILTPDRTRALAEELLREGDPQEAIGSTYVLRGGRYRDFGKAFTWRKPDGFWRVRVGADVPPDLPDATLYLEEPMRGISGMITLAAATNAEAYHQEQVAARLGDGVEPATPRRLGTVPALTSSGVWEDDDGTPIRHVLTTAVDGGRGVALVLWGRTADLTRAAAAVEAAIGGLRLMGPGFTAIEREGSTYRDRRMGYAISVPDDWKFSDETPREMKSIGSSVAWAKGARGVEVLAIHIPDPAVDREWALDLMEQRMRDLFGERTKATPDRSETLLDGAPARRVRWPRQDVEFRLLIRGQTIYGLVRGGDGKAIDEIADSFRWLD